MTNALRGEIGLKLGGRDFTLRPTFSSLCEIEDRLGRSLQIFGTELIMGAVRARDLIIVLECGLKPVHGTDTPSFDELGEMVLGEGQTSIQQPVIDFLSSLLDFYGTDLKKKATDRRSTSSKPMPKSP